MADTLWELHAEAVAQATARALLAALFHRDHARASLKPNHPEWSEESMADIVADAVRDGMRP